MFNHRRPSLAALATLGALAAPAVFAACGGGPKGRPTLPPPDYEVPSASPDASTAPMAPGPTAAPGPVAPPGGPAPPGAAAPGTTAPPAGAAPAVPSATPGRSR